MVRCELRSKLKFLEETNRFIYGVEIAKVLGDGENSTGIKLGPNSYDGESHLFRFYPKWHRKWAIP